jgi:hypothetical protein
VDVYFSKVKISPYFAARIWPHNHPKSDSRPNFASIRGLSLRLINLGHSKQSSAVLCYIHG